MECWASIFTLTFDTPGMSEMSAMCGSHALPPEEVPWYSFPLEAEWTPGLLNADRRIGSIQNFQGPHRESNPKPPILWHSASTNCATAHPADCCMYVSKALKGREC
jgi:hypothetical protein